jgi:hypothetical protein
MSENYLVTKKRFRITIEVEATVMDEPQADIDEFERGQKLPDKYAVWNKGDFLDYMRQQKRLLDAVLQFPDIAHHYILGAVDSEVVRYVGKHVLYDWDEDKREKGELLAQAIEKLPLADREWIQGLIGGGGFIENTLESLYEPFKAQVLGHSVEEIK